jgi:hypothetical protein
MAASVVRRGPLGPDFPCVLRYVHCQLAAAHREQGWLPSHRTFRIEQGSHALRVPFRGAVLIVAEQRHPFARYKRKCSRSTGAFLNWSSQSHSSREPLMGQGGDAGTRGGEGGEKGSDKGLSKPATIAGRTCLKCCVENSQLTLVTLKRKRWRCGCFSESPVLFELAQAIQSDAARRHFLAALPSRQ